MKPIGIGKLEKATSNGSNGISRHAFEPALQGKTVPVTNLTTTFSDEPEGQLSVDVYQTDYDLLIIAPVAGTSADQLNISITDDVITIKGRRDMPQRDQLKEAESYIEECFWGPFSRSIVLPTAVDTNHVEAHFKNNVLSIRIPKTERIRTRVIKINEA